MTREQMIDVLEDYCNKNICVSCKLYHTCESKQVFSDMTDEELENYVSDVKEKIQIKSHKMSVNWRKRKWSR